MKVVGVLLLILLIWWIVASSIDIGAKIKKRKGQRKQTEQQPEAAPNDNVERKEKNE